MSDIVKVKKPRLDWLDALRGFTMILVVANHVAGLGFGEEWKHSSAIPFLILFRMPLFFFVSGFLAYKASQIWDLKKGWMNKFDFFQEGNNRHLVLCWHATWHHPYY